MKNRNLENTLVKLADQANDESARADTSFSSHNVCTVNSEDIPKEVRMRSPYTYRELFAALRQVQDVCKQMQRDALIPDQCLNTFSNVQIGAEDLYIEIAEWLSEQRTRCEEIGYDL